jgi:hypothetical protein
VPSSRPDSQARPKQKPRNAGLLFGQAVDQKNEPMRTEKTLIHDQMTKPTTTTMGKP